MAAFDFDRIKHRWIIDEALYETRCGIYLLIYMSTGLPAYVGKFSGAGWDYVNDCSFNYFIADRIIRFLTPRNGQKHVPNKDKILVPRGHAYNFSETLRLIEIGEMYYAYIDTPYTKNVCNEFLTHWQRPDKDDIERGVTRNDGEINWQKTLNEFKELSKMDGGIRAILVEDCGGYSKEKIDKREKYWINYYNTILRKEMGDKISNYEYVLDDTGVENRQPSRELNVKCREELYTILRKYKAFKHIKAPTLYPDLWQTK